MPGPNDYHVNPLNPDELLPGLGKDELSDEQRLALRSRSGAALLKLKEEMDAQTAEMSERERALEAREHELALREARLLAAEKAGKKSGETAKTGTAKTPDVTDVSQL